MVYAIKLPTLTITIDPALSKPYTVSRLTVLYKAIHQKLLEIDNDLIIVKNGFSAKGTPNRFAYLFSPRKVTRTNTDGKAHGGEVVYTERISDETCVFYPRIFEQRATNGFRNPHPHTEGNVLHAAHAI